MPGKGGGRGRRRPARRPAFRRPPPEAVRRAAEAALARHRGPVPSQGALLRSVAPLLRREDPLFALGGRRLRALLLESPTVRVGVEFAERPTRRPLTACPVCGGPLAPIRNRTLLDDRVTLGYRCPRCGYWTHLKRRVPVRYSFRLRSLSVPPEGPGAIGGASPRPPA